MTIYEDKAAQVTAILKDYARDMAADLGKASRTRIENPDFGHVQPLASLAPVSPGILNQRVQLQAQISAEYARLAAGAHERPGMPSTAGELAARDVIRTLVDQIRSATTYTSASTLVASFI